MSDDTQSGATAQYETADTEPCPPHSASDFARIGYTPLDCMCATAFEAGKLVQYDDGRGFAYVDLETET